MRRKAVVGTNHEILFVFRRRRMFFNGQEAAGKDRRGIAFDQAAMVGGLLGLEPETRQLLALVLVVILAREVVHLELRMGIFFGCLRGSQQVLLRLQVVIVVELNFAGAKAPLRYPAVKMLLAPEF